jgi:hypothetical protein
MDFCDVDRDDPDFDEKMEAYNFAMDSVAGVFGSNSVAELIGLLKECKDNEMLAETFYEVAGEIRSALSELQYR